MALQRATASLGRVIKSSRGAFTGRIHSNLVEASRIRLLARIGWIGLDSVGLLAIAVATFGATFGWPVAPLQSHSVRVTWIGRIHLNLLEFTLLAVLSV